MVNEEIVESPLVSTIINNYNYGRFLREAIDSALNQTYPNLEIIVVDDGSTDDSREIIDSYGDRIIAVLKDNGGQASACNEGFRASKGEVVIFLDADDALLPDTVRRVVTAFQAHPGAVKVQYRQQFVDAYGRPTGELQPPCYQPMPSGDLRQHILKFREHTWPSTSGNAFASSVLRQILPIPEDTYRCDVDHYLCTVSAVFGSIISLDEVGSLYRVHGENNWYFASMIDMGHLRKVLLVQASSYAEQKRLFRVLYDAEAQEMRLADLYFLCNRVTSLKLDPLNHPFNDRLPFLCLRGCFVSITHPDPGLPRDARLLYALWFAAMLFTPKPLAKALASKLYHSENRGRILRNCLALLRRIRGTVTKGN
jgi:glycosyltransferase involved in cell wall biosynthesis